MSLGTPEKIRTLQRRLYRKAKAEPAFRFYVLYDKIFLDDILRHAYRLARAHPSAPGVDGVGFAEIEASGLEVWLAGLREDLVSKTYRPDPVRRVRIPKPDGGERPLGIPTIRDRVVQTAAKLMLEPIFEDNAYGYRPARGGGCGQGRALAPVPGLHRCGRRRPVRLLRFRTRTSSNRRPVASRMAPCCAWTGAGAVAMPAGRPPSS